MIIEKQKTKTQCSQCGGVKWHRSPTSGAWQCSQCKPHEQIAVEREPAKAKPGLSEGSQCDQCGGSELWQQRGTDRWRCLACEPPPMPAMVAKRSGSPDVQLIDIIIVGGAVPGCEACGGRWEVERVYSDGSCEVGCWTCQSVA